MWPRCRGSRRAPPRKSTRPAARGRIGASTWRLPRRSSAPAPNGRAGRSNWTRSMRLTACVLVGYGDGLRCRIACSGGPAAASSCRRSPMCRQARLARPGSRPGSGFFSSQHVTSTRYFRRTDPTSFVNGAWQLRLASWARIAIPGCGERLLFRSRRSVQRESSRAMAAAPPAHRAGHLPSKFRRLCRVNSCRVLRPRAARWIGAIGGWTTLRLPKLAMLALALPTAGLD